MAVQFQHQTHGRVRGEEPVLHQHKRLFPAVTALSPQRLKRGQTRRIEGQLGVVRQSALGRQQLEGGRAGLGGDGHAGESRGGREEALGHEDEERGGERAGEGTVERTGGGVALLAIAAHWK